jgi:hypothetical protein
MKRTYSIVQFLDRRHSQIHDKRPPHLDAAVSYGVDYVQVDWMRWRNWWYYPCPWPQGETGSKIEIRYRTADHPIEVAVVGRVIENA